MFRFLKKEQTAKSRSLPNLNAPIRNGLPPPSTKEYKKGLLTKQGAKVKNWKQRLFKLTENGLEYYKFRRGEEVFIDCIPLEPTCVVQEDTKSGRKFCFTVTTSNRTYYLCAENQTDLESWMRTIKSVIEYYGKQRESVNSISPLNIPALQKQDSFKKVTTPRSRMGSVEKTDEEEDRTRSEISASPPTSLSNSPSLNTVGGYSPIFPMSMSYERKDSHLESLKHNYVEYIPTSRRRPKLSLEEEYDIAISAAEIFLKDENERTAEEQAYVLAMRQYNEQLRNYMKSHSVKPEYGLASGTSIFCTKEEERTDLEKQYIKEIVQYYIEEIEDGQKEKTSLPVAVQSEILKSALKIFFKEADKRTPEETEYVERVRHCARQLKELSQKHNFRPLHNLLTAILVLGKYPEERDFYDNEIYSEIVSYK